MASPGTVFRAFVMDPLPLHDFVDRLRADERLPAFAAALPARARVAEAALPLLLAALSRGARPRILDPAPGRRRCSRHGRGGRLVHRRGARRAAAVAWRRASAPGSSRRRISWASGHARSPCSSAAASSARRLARSPSSSRRRRRARRRSGSPAATSRESICWPRRSSRPATPASNGWRSAARSPSAADSSTSSRPPAASRCGSSSSATRSRASAPSRRSRSGRSGEVDEATIYAAAERTLGTERDHPAR